jgi:hypothetical protein
MRRYIAASRKPGALVWSGNLTFSLDSASPPLMVQRKTQ